MITALLLTLLPQATAPRVEEPLAVGEVLDGRSALRDLRGSRRSYEELVGAAGGVLLFLGVDCPLANLYLPRVRELATRFGERGVRFTGVYSNENEFAPEIAAHASDADLPFLIVRDTGQRLADRVGAERTPTAVLLDAAGSLRYRGRIDDRYSVATRRPSAEQQELLAALEALLADRPIARAETDADGCLLDRTPLEPGIGEVTYHRDVAPILQSRCQACHREGQIGPFPLETYADAARRSRMLAEVTVERRMPPWHADPRYGHFANDRSLSAAEIAVFRAWALQGAPRGDASDGPKPPAWPEAWNVSTPDLVLTVPEAVPVPAEGVLDYHYVRMDPGFTEDVWVQEAQIRPGNARVLHHVLVYIEPPGASRGFSRLSRALVNWVPGTVSKVNPSGSATRIPAGSKLLWELHYTPNGQATTDQTSMALVFADEPPERETTFGIFADFWIKVAPGSSHHREEHTMQFRGDSRLVSLRPHMHLRGKSWRYELVHPDGTSQTLLNVPNWDFNWQTEYFFAEPIPIAEGTMLRAIAHFDNSPLNLANPDPAAEVRYGRQTFEEMMNGWVKYDLPVARGR